MFEIQGMLCDLLLNNIHSAYPQYFVHIFISRWTHNLKLYQSIVNDIVVDMGVKIHHGCADLT